eukprot:1086913-Pyramimonas_sp.AAC.1
MVALSCVRKARRRCVVVHAQVFESFVLIRLALSALRIPFVSCTCRVYAAAQLPPAAPRRPLSSIAAATTGSRARRR